MMQQKKTESHNVQVLANAAELRDLLHSLTRYFDACERHTTQSGDIIPSSYAQALMILLDFREKQSTPTLTNLVDMLDIDKSNVTRLCQRMQEAGHVVISRDTHDRRAKRLELSSDGEELAEFILNASLNRYEEVLSFFKNSERYSLLEQLMKLNTSLSKAAP